MIDGDGNINKINCLVAGVHYKKTKHQVITQQIFIYPTDVPIYIKCFQIPPSN